MLILGIDPGYAIVGYGLLEYQNNRFRTVDYGAITTPAGMDFSQRLEPDLPADANAFDPIPAAGDGSGKAVFSKTTRKPLLMWRRPEA